MNWLRVVVTLMVGSGLLCATPVFAGGNDIEVAGLQLVKKKRARSWARYNYYLYKVQAQNQGPQLQDVRGKVASTSADVRIVEGRLKFNDLAAGASDSSLDTFTVRIPAGATLDETVLVFTFSGTEVVGQDTIAPTITAEVQPAANAAGWHNSGVRVEFVCSDADSGIASCSAPVELDAEGAGQVVEGQAVDNAGNTASASVLLNIDTTAPEISAAISPAANANGWYNQDVSINFICTDSGSGIAGCSSALLISEEGVSQHQGEAGDLAGNTAATSVSVRLDKQAPEVSFNLAPSSDTAPAGDQVTALQQVQLQGQTEALRMVRLFRETDPDQALQTLMSDATGGFRVTDLLLLPGANILNVEVTDQAGNTGSASQNIQHLQCHDAPASRAFLVETGLLPRAAADSILYEPDSPAFAGRFLQLATADAERAEVLAGALNQDLLPDFISLDEVNGQLKLFINNGSGVLAEPVILDSGGSSPVSVVLEQLVGASFSDIAIAHKDGSVTFLEGQGDGNFKLRADLTISGLGAIRKLVAADFDQDGDTDLAVSAAVQLNLLLNDDDQVNSAQLRNGDFSDGLSGWQFSAVGQGPGSPAGAVDVSNGLAAMMENASFRTTLQQTFRVPDLPSSLSFELLALSPDTPEGDVPDVFMVSLLNSAGASVVDTADAASSAFFSSNPNAVPQTATGVLFDGTRVSLDISTLAPGTEVTLFFDLIGNPVGQGSLVSIDNVDAGAGSVTVDSFSVVPVQGPFSDAGGLDYCDVNADGLLDLLLKDTGQDQIFIYSGDGGGGFVRSQSLPQGGL